jgi:hypothetical protein
VVIRPKTIFVIAFCSFAFAATCYLLAFGGVVFFGAPTRPRQGFWRPEKLFYGMLPVFASFLIFGVISRLWARIFTRRRNAWLAGCVVAILAVALDAIAFMRFDGRQDERIQLVWRKESGVFSWGTGQVQIPAGFTYARETGIDTFVGRFTSEDGRLVIEYDIGELAAEHGGMGRSETPTEGSRVRFGRATYSEKGSTKYFFKVSFPDSGCANFSLESAREKDAAIAEFIARSFCPSGWTPSFLRPLLPEMFRSDCRYRLRLPGF